MLSMFLNPAVPAVEVPLYPSVAPSAVKVTVTVPSELKSMLSEPPPPSISPANAPEAPKVNVSPLAPPVRLPTPENVK